MASPQNTKDFGLIPIPRRLRYDPLKPFHFGMGLNIAFGFASTFIVANLYYCQPLLIQFSETFHNAPYTQVSLIPTLVQAGYATGLLLISPLGDLLPRRPLILSTVCLSTLFTIPLAITTNLRVFQALSYCVGVATVTPQILLPLAADLAPPARRASAISVVLSGLLFGILIARVLSGLIAQYTSWRVVYYFSLGVQTLVLIGSYLLLPDYPAKAGKGELTYGGVLKSMARYAVTEPVLVQATLVNLASSATFSCFWVTLTFLLGGEPYHYSTLIIGLFGLAGIAGVAFGPLVGLLIDRLVPWYASLFSILCSFLFQALHTALGGRHVGAVVVSAFGLDVFRQMLQVSLTTAAFSISTPARARLNAILILGIFIGQVLGTSLGTHLFVTRSFRASAYLSLGLLGVQVVLMGVRGPGVGRGVWVGWEGSWGWRRVKEEGGDGGVGVGSGAAHSTAIEAGTGEGKGEGDEGDEKKEEAEGESKIETGSKDGEVLLVPPSLTTLNNSEGGSSKSSDSSFLTKEPVVEVLEYEMVETKGRKTGE